MICPDCRKQEMQESRETVRYDECGLSNVALQGVRVRRCPGCGNQLVSIPNLEGLHRALAVTLVSKPERLSTEEIIFLRKSLGWSKTDFAKKFHVRKEQVSRWESEKNPVPMTLQNELLLRTLVAKGQRIEHYEDHLEEFASKEACGKSFFSMLFERQEWVVSGPLCPF